MSRRLLQAATAILSLIPIATGIIAMAGVGDPLYAALDLPRSPLLDSNLRFFGGVWLGLGLGMLYLVPSIERQTVLFRVLWGAVFLGGIGRALSSAFVGLPPLPFIGFTALEIIGAPLFVFWQKQVERSHA
jgi:uncharacterized protein DUF4345